jgi:hypothetical protein
VRKTSPPPGFGPRTFQPEESLYTDCAIPAPATIIIIIVIIIVIIIIIIIPKM